MTKETTINWNIKPKDGWKIEDFPRTDDKWKGIPIETLNEYGITVDNEKEYLSSQSHIYGHSREFIASINGVTYRASIYRHSVYTDGSPCYYIELCSTLDANDHMSLERNDWNIIDAWCCFSVFKEFV